MRSNEAAEVVEAPAQEGWYRARNRALLELLYGAGLRVSEAVNIKLTNLFFDVGFIKITGKEYWMIHNLYKP